MNDFWANRLGTARPAPRPEPVNTGRAWWDSSPQQATPQYAQQVAQQYAAPQEQLAIPRQAKSHNFTDTCPECGSRDYYAPVQEGGFSKMTGPSTPRCFSCGYPRMQTGSLGIQTHGGSAATPTRQIHTGASQVNNTPFAHI